MSFRELLEVIEEDCKEQVSDDHLEIISRSHCKHWRRLPAHLGLKHNVAEDIDKGPGDEGEKRHKFLLQWKEIKDFEATYKHLIYALLQIQCKQDAGSVCKILRKVSPSVPSQQMSSSAALNTASAHHTGKYESCTSSYL